MKKKPLVVIAVMLVSGLFYFTYTFNFSTLHRDIKFLGHAVDAQWSKDGKALFYTISTDKIPKLYRYDIQTGNIKTYDLPRFAVIGFCDISPDEKEILSWKEGKDGDELYITSLHTKKAKKIFDLSGIQFKSHEIPDRIESTSWISQDVIFLTVGCSGYANPYILNPRNCIKRKLSNTNVFEVYPANDGSSFIYLNEDNHYHIVDMQNRADKVLDVGELKKSKTFRFLYLSKRMLVYSWWSPTHKAEILDLKTMKTRPIYIPYLEMHDGGSISPNLTKQWFEGPSYREEESMLYLQDLPEDAIAQMRKVEAQK